MPEKSVEIAKKLQELECEEEPVWDEEAVMDILQKGMEKAIHDYLNSPQFKKQYAKIPRDGKNPYFVKTHTRIEEVKQDVWNEGYVVGQQNPDPKQYAKREKLEKVFDIAFFKGSETTLDFLWENMPEGLSEGARIMVRTRIESLHKVAREEAIRTHGLEE